MVHTPASAEDVARAVLHLADAEWMTGEDVAASVEDGSAEAAGSAGAAARASVSSAAVCTPAGKGSPCRAS